MQGVLIKVQQSNVSVLEHLHRSDFLHSKASTKHPPDALAGGEFVIFHLSFSGNLLTCTLAGVINTAQRTTLLHCHCQRKLNTPGGQRSPRDPTPEEELAFKASEEAASDAAEEDGEDAEEEDEEEGELNMGGDIFILKFLN